MSAGNSVKYFGFRPSGSPGTNGAAGGAQRLDHAAVARARMKLRGIHAELGRPGIDRVRQRGAELAAVAGHHVVGALEEAAAGERGAVGAGADRHGVAAVGVPVDARIEGAALVRRVALEVELVEALDRRGRRDAEPGEDLRHRDSRLLLALQHAGPGQRRDVDRVQVAQAAEDEEAVAPVELLLAQGPFERHGRDALAAARVEVVEHDAAEARARLGAGVAQRCVRRVAVGDVAPGMVGLRQRIVVPRLDARQDAVVAVLVLQAQIAVDDLRDRSRPC